MKRKNKKTTLGRVTLYCLFGIFLGLAPACTKEKQLMVKPIESGSGGGDKPPGIPKDPGII